jgi:hypothetical protein
VDCFPAYGHGSPRIERNPVLPKHPLSFFLSFDNFFHLSFASQANSWVLGDFIWTAIDYVGDQEANRTQEYTGAPHTHARASAYCWPPIAEFRFFF